MGWVRAYIEWMYCVQVALCLTWLPTAGVTDE